MASLRNFVILQQRKNLYFKSTNAVSLLFPIRQKILKVGLSPEEQGVECGLSHLSNFPFGMISSFKLTARIKFTVTFHGNF